MHRAAASVRLARHAGALAEAAGELQQPAEQDRRASAAEVAALASALRATDARVERLADMVDTQLAEIKELLLRKP